MQEIVTVDGVTRLFLALAVLAPVLGLLIAGVMIARRAERGDARRWGLLVGLCGPGNWLLWKLYNALTEHNGLDTVRNFEINLVVFVLIGLALGLALNRLQPSAKPEVAPAEQPPPSDLESNGEQGA
jgi:hypothetical protein